MNIVKKLILITAAIFIATSMQSYAGGKVYPENEFINSFSGKSMKVVSEKLGKPTKIEHSVKPSNAGAMTGSIAGGNVDDKSSKPVKVEMWYYKNLVKYDAKHTYSETEITFVNDRVMNIAFFNNKK
jgi:hypothetical protein